MGVGSGLEPRLGPDISTRIQFGKKEKNSGGKVRRKGFGKRK